MTRYILSAGLGILIYAGVAGSQAAGVGAGRLHGHVLRWNESLWLNDRCT